MTRLYRLGYCGVSLQEAGYRLRPASEVIRSAYGTLAELVNLDVTLQQAAGLEAEVALAAGGWTGSGSSRLCFASIDQR